MGEAPSEQSDRGVAIPDADEHARTQRQSAPGGHVVAQCDLVPGAAEEVTECTRIEQRLGRALEVGQRDQVPGRRAPTASHPLLGCHRIRKATENAAASCDAVEKIRSLQVFSRHTKFMRFPENVLARGG